MDQGPGAVPVILHHTEGRNVQSHILHNVSGHPNMLQSAVDQQQVRGSQKFFVSIQHPPESPPKHLIHTGIVVGAIHVLDLEPAVVPFQGAPILVYHHRGHHVVLARIGDIVGLHPPGDHIQIQHPPQQLQQFILPLLSGGCPLYLLLGVLVSQTDQLHLGPPLGGGQFHPTAHLLAQQTLQWDMVGQLTGQQNLLGQAAAAHIVFPDEGGHRVPLIVLHRCLYQVEVLGRQVALHIVQHHKAAFGLPPVESAYVRIRQRARHHLLPLP